MSQPSVHQGAHHWTGAQTYSSTVTLPSGTVTNAMVASGAAIEATKVVHQFPLVWQQATGSAAASATAEIHCAYAAGTIVSVKAMVDTAAVGDSTVTVDLQNGDAAGAFATVLTGAISITSATAVRTPVAGTISSATYAADDQLRLVVTATAGTGTLPQGLMVVVVVRENAQ